MDKRREELEEQKADLHLAMLMDEYAEQMGKQAREEAEAAFARGELQMPPELDAACRDLISEAPVAEAAKKPMKTAARYALVAAATIVLLFGTLIAVQAAGIDVFGSIATWTNSVFHFQTTVENVKEDPSAASKNQIQVALDELGIPDELAPTWFPEGYEIRNISTSEPADPVLVVQCDIQKDNCPLINVIIKKSNKSDVLLDADWEKEKQPAELYTINGRTFYVFENTGTWTGIWSDSEQLVLISGAASEEQLKTILIGIGGKND